MAIPTYETKVARIVQETSNTKTLYIVVPDEFTFRPGQFVMAIFELNGKEERRAYSISTSPDEKGEIGLTIKLEPNGKGGSIRLHEYKKGEPIKVQGPFGMFVPEDKVTHAVMIAAGSGIAPFRAMWRYRLAHKLGHTDVLFSAPNMDSLIFYDEMSKIMREHEDFHAYFTITRECPGDWCYGKERLTLDRIQQECKDYQDSTFYLCGSPQFCEAMKQSLLDDNVPKERVKMEKYW